MKNAEVLKSVSSDISSKDRKVDVILKHTDEVFLICNLPYQIEAIAESDKWESRKPASQEETKRCWLSINTNFFQFES